MDLPDLNCTPPVEDGDEMDEDARNEMHENAGEEMEGDGADEMENDEIVQDPGVEQVVRKYKTLNDQQKYAAYVALHTLCMSRGGKFQRDDKKNIAAFFGVGVWHIQRVWRKAMEQIEQGLEVNVASQRPGNCGRKPKDINLDQIPTIPLNKRTTIRSLAWQLGCSPTTLHRKFMLKLIRRHTNCVKPVLKEKNKKDRINFCLSMLDETTIETGRPKFKTMHNIVHIDEKWFYMTKKDRNYYLLDGEEEPTRTIQHGSCIGKVMFLTAVARPRWDSEGNVTFSGKIGIWPFVKEVPAQRRSDNRPRGTMETKTIKVNRQVMREFMIDNLLTAIQATWPDNDVCQTIYIQQDNAKPHILPNDPEFAAAVERTGLDIRLIQQPANSPDLNGLDLGFFHSLQSLTDCLSPKTLQDLIKGVLDEFEGYDAYKLNRIFLSLQAVMIEVLNYAGGNGYKIPHVNKERLEHIGMLPLRLTCPQEVYANAIHNLGLMGSVH